MNLKEALSNVFLVVVFAGMEVKEHCLPSCSRSSNTILCVGVSSSECRLCVLRTPRNNLLSAAYGSPIVKRLVPQLAACTVEIWSYLFFGCLFIVHVDFYSVEDGRRGCKNCLINRSVSKQRMRNIMGLQGGHKKGRGVDFLLLYVFIAPLTSANRWHPGGTLA